MKTGEEEIDENREQTSSDIIEEVVEELQVLGDGKFPCDQCHAIFVSEKDLENHVVRYHEETNVCRFCPFKASLAEPMEHLTRNFDEENTVGNEVVEIEEVNQEVSVEGVFNEVNAELEEEESEDEGEDFDDLT